MAAPCQPVRFLLTTLALHTSSTISCSLHTPAANPALQAHTLAAHYDNTTRSHTTFSLRNTDRRQSARGHVPRTDLGDFLRSTQDIRDARAGAAVPAANGATDDNPTTRQHHRRRRRQRGGRAQESPLLAPPSAATRDPTARASSSLEDSVSTGGDASAEDSNAPDVAERRYRKKHFGLPRKTDLRDMENFTEEIRSACDELNCVVCARRLPRKKFPIRADHRCLNLCEDAHRRMMEPLLTIPVTHALTDVRAYQLEPNLAALPQLLNVCTSCRATLQTKKKPALCYATVPVKPTPDYLRRLSRMGHSLVARRLVMQTLTLLQSTTGPNGAQMAGKGWACAFVTNNAVTMADALRLPRNPAEVIIQVDVCTNPPAAAAPAAAAAAASAGANDDGGTGGAAGVQDTSVAGAARGARTDGASSSSSSVQPDHAPMEGTAPAPHGPACE